MPPPDNPKIYHIVHVDKLAAIAADGFLYSDAAMAQRPANGTVIGMGHIKQRRMHELTLTSHPDLYVGQCVPFYFTPRSVMLYMMAIKSAELAYKGGQEAIVHLVSDMRRTVAWAEENELRWAFTLSNAGSRHFEDRANLESLHEIRWDAVNAHYWSSVSDQKQAEFLIEQQFPWHLIEQIVVYNQATGEQAVQAIAGVAHRPDVQKRLAWYY